MKTQSKKKDVLVAFFIMQETENSNFFDGKLYSRERQMPYSIQHEENWLGWIVIEKVNCK